MLVSIFGLLQPVRAGTFWEWAQSMPVYLGYWDGPEPDDYPAEDDYTVYDATGIAGIYFSWVFEEIPEDAYNIYIRVGWNPEGIGYFACVTIYYYWENGPAGFAGFLYYFDNAGTYYFEIDVPGGQAYQDITVTFTSNTGDEYHFSQPVLKIIW